MNTTTNYNLPQWEDTDAVKRSDFNSAMSAIDAAIAGAPKIAVGTYSGTHIGYDGTSAVQHISVGFLPKAVLVCAEGYDFAERGALIVRGVPLISPSFTQVVGEIDTDGFTLTSVFHGGTLTRPYINRSGYTYYYIAIG